MTVLIVGLLLIHIPLFQHFYLFLECCLLSWGALWKEDASNTSREMVAQSYIILDVLLLWGHALKGEASGGRTKSCSFTIMPRIWVKQWNTSLRSNNTASLLTVYTRWISWSQNLKFFLSSYSFIPWAELHLFQQICVRNNLRIWFLKVTKYLKDYLTCN